MGDYFQDSEKKAFKFNSNAYSTNISIHEIDENGISCATHRVSNNDTIHRSLLRPSNQGWSNVLAYNQQDLTKLFAEIFLPTGYPHSVRSDYITYQIYDSLQAFSSSIASLFANRAVLSAVGVGDDSASSTSALLMKIVQETVGRLGTIVFAWKYGASLEPECKKYRFMADIVNDGATVFDCLSPFFPFSKSLTILMLCFSGLLRAVCGVMATGSRSALTLHFTEPERGSIADVNAKDQSQETVISLMGMLAGSVAVSTVTGEGATMWAVVVTLLSIHLYTNYQAVRSVIMVTLNRQRANIVFADIINSLDSLKSVNHIAHGKMLLSPRKVAHLESILQSNNILKNTQGVIIGTADFVEFLVVEKYSRQLGLSVGNLLSVRKSGYIICYEMDFNNKPKVGITLVENEGSTSGRHVELRAWVHAYLICLQISKKYQQTPIETIQETEKILEYVFTELDICTGLEAAGWDLSSNQIIGQLVRRIRVIEDDTLVRESRVD